MGGSQDSVIMVRDLFRNEGQTEFVIATIPTMLGINESARLIKALRKERIPCTKIVVNQASHQHPWHVIQPQCQHNLSMAGFSGMLTGFLLLDSLG